MTDQVIAYDKCLCCGKIQGASVRFEGDTEPTDKSILWMMAHYMGDVSTGFCIACNMETAKMRVAYDTNCQATIPEEMMVHDETKRGK